MLRSIASRLSVLVAALTLAACSSGNPVAPQFTESTGASTGLVAIPFDPTIFDILVSNCDEAVPPIGRILSRPWQQQDGSGSIELGVGCYDFRVYRLTADGMVSRVQRVLISGGDFHYLGA